jgi:hypothetical protein
MSFSWAAFVTLAEWLLTQPTGPLQEASQRSAISRAYYGAFRTTRDLVAKRKIYTPTAEGRDHFGVINACKRHPNMAYKKVGADLERLYRSRCLADYDAAVNNLPSEGQVAVVTAKRILSYVVAL